MATTNDLHAVTFANGTFVAVGTGVILTSRDGERWVAHETLSRLAAVAFGSGKFVAVGDDYDPYSQKARLLVSNDGEAWTSVDGEHWT